MSTFYALLGIIFLIGIPARLLLFNRIGDHHDMAVFGNAFGGVAGLACAGLALSLRRFRWSARAATRVGISLEILLGLAVSLVEQGFGAYEGLPPRLPYASILILTFPVVVPLGRQARAVSVFGTALTVPAAALLHHLETGEAVPAIHLIPSCVVLFFMCVISLGAARIVYRLAESAQQAYELGSYRLVRKLGEGGMGEVWVGEHRMLVRPAAIKLIRAGAQVDEHGTTRARFEREANATSSLRSPHTVQLYDFGLSDNGAPYYAMELLNGMDLDSFVRRFGPMPAARVASILKQACLSLAEAHDAGLVHRDIKPANLFLCRLGPQYDFVKVLDFGLVKPKENDETELSRENATAGTPAFMPPELALGEAFDGRADLYSLGCVAYWLLTGRTVFAETRPVQMIVAHVKEAPLPPSSQAELEIPAELEALIMQCLEKAPADRPRSAHALAARIDELGLDGMWSSSVARQWWQEHAPEVFSSKLHPAERSPTAAEAG